mmetsp:Transcript_12507/g.24698  ORF Transcript_12507/g.24698 Transcript_12507/m.24698 type:complete len:208 (+) Transcript_12507:61-684(+)
MPMPGVLRFLFLFLVFILHGHEGNFPTSTQEFLSLELLCEFFCLNSGRRVRFALWLEISTVVDSTEPLLISPGTTWPWKWKFAGHRGCRCRFRASNCAQRLRQTHAGQTNSTWRKRSQQQQQQLEQGRGSGASPLQSRGRRASQTRLSTRTAATTETETPRPTTAPSVTLFALLASGEQAEWCRHRCHRRRHLPNRWAPSALAPPRL